MSGVRSLDVLVRHVISSAPITVVSESIGSTGRAMSGLRAAATSAHSPSHNKRKEPGQDIDDRAVYIVSAARTPLGKFQGGLAAMSATDLGAVAVRAAVARSGVGPELVNEVFLGNVCWCPGGLLVLG